MFQKLITVFSIIIVCFIFPTIAPQIINSKVFDSTVLAQENIGTLTANNRDSRINLRSRATTSSTSLGYGLPGDRVEIIGCSADESGRTGLWLEVRFIKPPHATGWIRADFICTRVSFEAC